MVDAKGIISTIAGNGTDGFGGDGGPATSAMLNEASDVALDSSGNLYIADYGNNRIRMVSPDGVISTVAGDGNFSMGGVGDGGPATSASLWAPSSIAVDSNGNIYIADSAEGRVRMVSPNGIISTFAGSDLPPSGNDGDGGPATSATLQAPTGVAVDNNGNVYIADVGTNSVRKVTAAGIISTISNPYSVELSVPIYVSVDNLGGLVYPNCAENPVLQGGDAERGERSSP